MLTIRLMLNGVATAFQTNRAISLVAKHNQGFDELLGFISDPMTTRITDIEPDEKALRIGDRIAESDVCVIVKFDGSRGEHMTWMAGSAHPDGMRLISLCEGDSVHILDSGAVLFKWPTESNAAGHS
ncbi:hypothetical protein D8682_25260 [Buttiauxella sp. 3AFRM03]|uniref:hypothetical protein n=1 Tax=Buttiauxella sp. 3AFRM03 TaxID=2479367 RepID=UPI000EF7A2AB|nr:hypothetical protein [Buttiauxella sp. 3AFRM03]AYN29994.1 hypothetical protein D8682_25260 [Buttiauxella sp. 3AFRM03]